MKLADDVRSFNFRNISKYFKISLKEKRNITKLVEHNIGLNQRQNKRCSEKLTSTLDADSTKVSTICLPIVPLTTFPENQFHKIADFRLAMTDINIRPRGRIILPSSIESIIVIMSFCKFSNSFNKST